MPNTSQLLVVDSIVQRRSALAIALKAASFDVVFSNSATSALAMLGGQPVTGIIAEYELPRRNGLWLLDQVLATGAPGARILLTRHQPDVAHARYHHVMVKPVRVDDIVALLRRDVWTRSITAPDDGMLAPIAHEPD